MVEKKTKPISKEEILLKYKELKELEKKKLHLKKLIKKVLFKGYF